LILSAYPAAKIDVIYTDHNFAGAETLDINNLELHAKGGSGADFKSVYECIGEKNRSC